MSRIDIKNPYIDMQYTHDLADYRSVDLSYEKGAERGSIYEFLLMNKDKFRYALYMMNTSLLPFYRQQEYRVTYIVTPDEYIPDELKEMITNLDKTDIINLIKYNTINKPMDLRYVQSTTINYMPSQYKNETFFISSNHGNWMLNNQAQIKEQIKLPTSTVLISDKLIFPSVFGL